MSRVCSICGKGQTSGNNVSHSNRKTKRAFKANVQKVSFIESQRLSRDLLHTVQCLLTGIIEIIHNDNFIIII